MTEEQVLMWREERNAWTLPFRRCNHTRQLDHNGNDLPCVVRGCPQEYRDAPELKVIRWPERISLDFDPRYSPPPSVDVVLYRRMRANGHDFWSCV